MRLACAAVALVVAMSGNDMERALSIARAREAERQQFHSRYIFNLTDPTVTQFEIVTEFRRLVLIGEDHVLHGDYMFTRGLRAAEQALASSRGMLTIRAQVRFNPLNTFIASPDYELAVGTPAGVLLPVDTQLTPQFSTPFKNRQGKTSTTLIGATIESMLPAEQVGQASRPVAVTLDGKVLARITVEFNHLD